MRNLIATLSFIVCIGSLLQAQQAPQYSHYVFNQFQLNPAVAGTKSCLDLRFGFRNQWAGFEDGPKTQFGSINTRLGRSTDKSDTWHAVGIKFESDQAGRFTHSLVQGAYAYHFKMGRETYGSIGLFIGFNQFKVDLAGAAIENLNDPILSAPSQQNFIVPEVHPGFWMHNKEFFLGVSAKHVVSGKILDEGNFTADTQPEAKLLQHLNLTTGYAYSVGKKTNFIPTARLGYVAAAPVAIDINAMLDYDKRLALGVGYRNGGAVVGLMKLNFLNYFTLGYAYDFTVSDLRALSGSTHEVMLGISACAGSSSGRHVPCSAYD